MIDGFYLFDKISFVFLLTNQSPTTDPLICAFWRVWGHEQLACKVFPTVMAGRSVQRLGNLLYGVTPATGGGPDGGATFTSVPIKEGLHSIIKCLKAQDVGHYGKKTNQPLLDSNICKFLVLDKNGMEY